VPVRHGAAVGTCFAEQAALALQRAFQENNMSLRLGALLCLTGMAACSHNTEAVQDPSAEQSTVASTDPSLQPASLENSDSPRSRTDADARAPVVADTKGTAPNASPSPSPGAAAEPSKASVDPPAAAESAPPASAPDNTKVNKRDANSAAPTPMDQNNNQTDLKITQQIRQAVMADGSLSFTAKNVKIIAQNGKVTLRGPVNTAQERDAIDAAARKVAGVTQVDNQLEVKK
jgi:hyperosmotically inducible periplasmic protein